MFTSDRCYGLDEADVLGCVSPIQPEELQRFRQDIGEQITDTAGRINAVYDELYAQDHGAAQSSLDDCVRGIENLVMSMVDDNDDHDRYGGQTDSKTPGMLLLLSCPSFFFSLSLSLPLFDSLLPRLVNKPLSDPCPAHGRRSSSPSPNTLLFSTSLPARRCAGSKTKR